MSYGLRLSNRRNMMERYRNMPLIKKICECPCKEPFETKTKKTRFKSPMSLHYARWRVANKIHWKKKPKFRLNKVYRENPYLIKDLNSRTKQVLGIR